MHGRPRHPQSQGLVEQANGTLERMLAAMIAEKKSNHWISYLPKIMYNLNTQKSSSTNFMPFKIVFAIQPNTGMEKTVEVIDERACTSGSTLGSKLFNN